MFATCQNPSTEMLVFRQGAERKIGSISDLVNFMVESLHSLVYIFMVEQLRAYICINQHTYVLFVFCDERVGDR